MIYNVAGAIAAGAVWGGFIFYVSCVTWRPKTLTHYNSILLLSLLQTLIMYLLTR